MATNTRGTTARNYNKQLVHEVSFSIAYNDPGIASGVAKQYLPVGAVPLRSSVLVTAAFNAGSTNVLTVGTNGATANNLVASGDVNEASAQMFGNISPTAGGPLAAAVPVYVKYTQTGTAASAGGAIVIVEYIANVS